MPIFTNCSMLSRLAKWVTPVNRAPVAEGSKVKVMRIVGMAVSGVPSAAANPSSISIKRGRSMARNFEDERPRERYVAESRRLLGVFDQQLAGRAWIMGDEYSIADIATFPWVADLIGFYEAADLVGFADFAHVARVLDAFLARPAVVAGMGVPSQHSS